MAFFGKIPDDETQAAIIIEENDQEVEASDKLKDFSEFWGPIMPTIRVIKNVGHALSAITEFVVLRQIFAQEASKLVQYGEAIVSLLLAVCIAVIIEIGISKFMPFVFRFFFRKKWDNKWSIAMIIPIIIIVTPLCFIGVTMSADGGFLVVDKSTAETKSTDLSKEDDTYELQRTQENARYTKKEASINQQYDKQVSANKAAYASKIAIQNGKIADNKKKVANGHQWASSHISTASAKIKALEAERDEKETAIEADRTTALADALTAHEGKIAKIDKKEGKHLSKKEKEDEDKATKRTQFVGTWGGIMSYIAIFAVLGTIFCIAIIEIYRAGAGQEYDKRIDDGSPNRWQRIFGAVYRKATDAIDAGIDWMEERNAPRTPATNQAPTPPLQKPYSLPAFESASPPASMQAAETQRKAANEARRKYNPNSVRSWYKRSSLCANPTVSDADALERNRQKYLKAKAAYAQAGVEIEEFGNTISIKF